MSEKREANYEKEGFSLNELGNPEDYLERIKILEAENAELKKQNERLLNEIANKDRTIYALEHENKRLKEAGK